MAYETNDGQVFNSQIDAANHANRLAAYNRAWVETEKKANEQHFLRVKGTNAIYNKMVKYFNENDWKAVIETYNDNKYNLDNNSRYVPHAWRLRYIAMAIINNDYVLAFRAGNWGEEYSGKDIYIGGVNEADKAEGNKICQAALAHGNKLFEIQHGRTATENDIMQMKITNKERTFVQDIKEFNDHVAKNGFKPDEYYQKSTLDRISYGIRSWEELTGRKMTKEDQIRISGQVFPTSSNSDGKSTSSGKGILIKLGIAVVIIYLLYQVLSFFGFLPF